MVEFQGFTRPLISNFLAEILGSCRIPISSIVLNPNIREIDTLLIIFVDIIVKGCHRHCVGSKRDTGEYTDGDHQNHC